MVAIFVGADAPSRANFGAIAKMLFFKRRSGWRGANNSTRGACALPKRCVALDIIWPVAKDTGARPCQMPW